MTCKQCKNFDECQFDASYQGATFDPNFDGEHGCTAFDPFTNADRIRAMSDEELAQWLGRSCCPSDPWKCVDGSCKDCWLEWLQQPAEGE